ncbi:MAG: phosphoribosylformylglycinamidine cyclo-ligase [Firmicutes bacterium]|nr:phosphoribosylformylglycinamidine cyclo-ligase [Bacillota bacterium]
MDKSTYKASGVDIQAGYEVVRRIKKHTESTFRPEVLSNIGSFGSFFALDTSKYREPILVAGTDGVGTKLKIAFMMDKHDTIGIDVVAYCVNDIICQGAEPLFFLDYLAVGKNYPEKVESIIAGVAEGCRQAGCALVGGETAEMPGFYPEDEYDLAGFAVGVVEKSRCITGQQAKAGDVVIGLASSGLQSSGFSLVRKIFFHDHDYKVTDHFDELGRTLGEELLEPTLIYVKPILSLIDAVDVTGIANISGGGIPENIPRSMPDNLDAVIRKGSWPVHPIFAVLQRLGEVEETEMYNTFNMGIGMVVIVKRDHADKALDKLAEWGIEAYIIGELVPGQGKVVFG